MNMTPVTMVGTVVRDVRGRRVGDDDALVVNFRVASNERRYERESGTWVDGESLFLTVTCWRRLAENVLASLVKGDPVVVTGKLRTREFEGKDGEPRSVTEMEATSVGPDLARCTTVLKRTRRVEPSAEAKTDRSTEVVAADATRLTELAEAVGPLVPALT